MKSRPLDDLCGSCQLAVGCVYAFPGREPVEECEGYVGEGSAPLTHLEGRQLHLGLRQGSSSETFAGLCVNCSLRFVCTRERPPSGVWHCVDYC